MIKRTETLEESRRTKLLKSARFKFHHLGNSLKQGLLFCSTVLGRVNLTSHGKV